MRNLRVLFLSSAEEMSGTYVRAFFLAKYLAREGHQVSLIASEKRPTLAGTKKLVDRVKILLLPFLVDYRANLLHKQWSAITTGFMQTIFNSILQATSYFDVLHTFDVLFPQNAIPMLFSRLTCHLRINTHTIFADWDELWGGGGLLSLPGARYPFTAPFLEFLEEKVPLFADAVTVANETLGQRALTIGVQRENLFVIPNGANIESIESINVPEARKMLGLTKHRAIYTHVMSSTRDIETFRFLMATHKEVLKNRPDATLLLLGKLSKDQADFIKSSDMARSILCPGSFYDQRFSVYLGASDAFLLLLRDTVFDRTRWPARLGDYLAAGRPTIAPDLPEMRKVIHKCGFLAKVYDPKDFAAKILEAISNPEVCAEKGKLARELAETKYAWRNIAKQLENSYKQFL